MLSLEVLCLSLHGKTEIKENVSVLETSLRSQILGPDLPKRNATISIVRSLKNEANNAIIRRASPFLMMVSETQFVRKARLGIETQRHVNESFVMKYLCIIMK
jgi:hypothetical protein